MKRIIIFLISLLTVNYCIGSGSLVRDVNLKASDTIRVLSSPDLYNLSVTWGAEYNKLFPETKIRVINVPDAKMEDSFKAEEGNIGFVSNEFFSGLSNGSLIKIVVGRDVIVPVINSKNPFMEEISKNGISPERLAELFVSAGTVYWGKLLNGTQKERANFYILNDESVSRGISEFLKTGNADLGGIKAESAEEMISAIQKDPYAIGFCKMINVIDLNNQVLAGNISLLPIDSDGNGTLDYNEKIYDDLNIFSRGLWIGKYPKTLFSNIFSVLPKKTGNENEVAFLKWVLDGGQQFLNTSGYSDLLLTERKLTTDKLFETQVSPVVPVNEKSELGKFLFMIAILVLAGIAVDFIIRYSKRRRPAETQTGSLIHSALNENSLVIPRGLFFDKTHTWAFMEQSGVVKVGIDDFLQHITGKITRIKMKNEGDMVKKGEEILSVIQNGKQLNIYAPISGIIKEKNIVLDSNASLINSSPYNEGWVYRIEPSNWARENQLLFMADKQIQYLKSEFSRFREFLAEALKSDDAKYAQLILQDGGELIDNTLSNLGPEVWEDFQSKFIDPSRHIWFYEMF